MTDEATSVQSIIKRAGGASRIAELLGGRLTSDAIYKWPKIGIPDRHWPLIMRLSGASADEMLAANVSARKMRESAA